MRLTSMRSYAGTTGSLEIGLQSEGAAAFRDPEVVTVPRADGGERGDRAIEEEAFDAVVGERCNLGARWCPNRRASRSTSASWRC